MPENIRVEGVTTLQGRYMSTDGMFDAIKNAGDVAEVITYDGDDNPLTITYTSDKVSTIYKAVETMTWDGTNMTNRVQTVVVR